MYLHNLIFGCIISPMITTEKIVEITSHILEGLTQEEACIVCDEDPSELKDLIETNPSVKKFIDKANINFKLAHLKAIQSKKSGNNSQWILEKLRPNEFGSKANINNGPINIIGEIIQNIQNGEQKSKLAPRTRGELLIEESERGEGSITVEGALR